MMVTFVVSCKAREGKEAAAEVAIRELVASVRDNEPLALAYAFHRSVQDSREMVLCECYDSEAAFAEHNASEHMVRFRSLFQELFDPATTQIRALERIWAVLRPGPVAV